MLILFGFSEFDISLGASDGAISGYLIDKIKNRSFLGFTVPAFWDETKNAR